MLCRTLLVSTSSKQMTHAHMHACPSLGARMRWRKAGCGLCAGPRWRRGGWRGKPSSKLDRRGENMLRCCRKAGGGGSAAGGFSVRLLAARSGTKVSVRILAWQCTAHANLCLLTAVLLYDRNSSCVLASHAHTHIDMTRTAAQHSLVEIACTLLIPRPMGGCACMRYKGWLGCSCKREGCKRGGRHGA